MTTIPVGQTGQTGQTAQTAQTSQTAQAAQASSNPLNQLDNTQTFLKLLVAQLQNQSPDNPQDPTAFMTELSQLTAVESQNTLASEEQVVAADSMIGRDVTGMGANGTQVSGMVTGVLLNPNGTPELQIGTGGTQLSLSSVTQVQQPPAASGSSGTSPGTSSGTSSGATSGTTSGTSSGTGA
jgi:flagellar basal-body rod modification protein FlgD